MNVAINGESKELNDKATILDVLSALGHDEAGRGVAVAVNGDVVPRVEWGARPLQEGDRVEVLTAVGGG